MIVLAMSLPMLLITQTAYSEDNSCNGLYAGKAINLQNHGAGALFGDTTLPAIVLGVDKENGLVSIKLTDSGDTKEGSCSSLKAELVN